MENYETCLRFFFLVVGKKNYSSKQKFKRIIMERIKMLSASTLLNSADLYTMAHTLWFITDISSYLT